MTKRILDMLDLDLAVAFLGNILAIYQCIETKEEFEEYISCDASTRGCYQALKEACERTHKEPIIDYLNNLEWFDYDINIEEIATTLLELYVNNTEDVGLRIAYYHYIGGVESA